MIFFLFIWDGVPGNSFDNPKWASKYRRFRSPYSKYPSTFWSTRPPSCFLLDVYFIDRQQALNTSRIEFQHPISLLCLGLSMWPSPRMASAIVPRYFPQWMDYFGGLRIITKSLCPVWKHMMLIVSIPTVERCCGFWTDVIPLRQRRHSQQQ